MEHLGLTEVNYAGIIIRQLLIDICLGIVLIVLFLKEFAERDAEYPTRQLSETKQKIKELSLVVLCITIASIVALIIQEWLNLTKTNIYNQELFLISESYRRVALLLSALFIVAALTGYIWKYKKSPRSIFVKIRKGLGYYLLIGTFFSHVMRSISPSYIILLEEGFSLPVLGIVLGECVPLLLVWLLVRQYKVDRYVAKNNTELQSQEELDNTRKAVRKKTVKRTILLLVFFELLTIILTVILTIVKYNDVYAPISDTYITLAIGGGLSLLLLPIVLYFLFKYKAERKGVIRRLFADTKKLLALYIGYGLVLLLIFTTWIIIQIINNKNQIGIPIIVLLFFSILPIGIYWIIKLVRNT